LKICRFDENKIGVVREDQIYDATSALDALASYRYPLPLGDPFIVALPSLRDKMSALADHAPAVPVSAARLLSPVANPSKIIGAPVNYKKHLDEVTTDPNLHHQNVAHTRPIQQAGLFLKATSSLVGALQGVVLRHPDRRTDHEVELAVIIGDRTDRVSAKDALQHVAGYCIGLDITVRGPEDRSMRKSIDTYSVLGPWLVTADEIPDPGALDLSLTVNGEPRQSSNTRNLIMGVAELIEWASSFYTLLPGDVIMTGTPDGVGPIATDDVLHARIDRIGEMTVRVH
jgi:2,4-didehydro-3-deoxy-L-rhamnonate hydrolase